MQSPEDILRKHDLRKTHLRISLIHLLQQSEHAVSQPDLEKDLGELSDRVTLYRALKSFEEHGIVHRVYDSSGTARYALCDDCHHHHHEDRHLHFNCTSCENVYCLEGFVMPGFLLPQGFIATEVQLVIKGICSQCSKKA